MFIPETWVVMGDAGRDMPVSERFIFLIRASSLCSLGFFCCYLFFLFGKRNADLAHRSLQYTSFHKQRLQRSRVMGVMLIWPLYWVVKSQTSYLIFLPMSYPFSPLDHPRKENSPSPSHLQQLCSRGMGCPASIPSSPRGAALWSDLDACSCSLPLQLSAFESGSDSFQLKRHKLLLLLWFRLY